MKRMATKNQKVKILNLTRKEIEVSIDGEDYIMAFDNRSIATYKEVIGKPFTKRYAELL